MDLILIALILWLWHSQKGILKRLTRLELPAAPRDEARAPMPAPSDAPGAAAIGIGTPPPAPRTVPAARAARPDGLGGSPTEAAQSSRMRALEVAAGTRWTVWAGALLLAIGGTFLVRYGIERGFFTPAMRVASGLAFGFACAAAGEALRRRGSALPQLPLGVPSIPALLTGVGGLAAFGSIYAAHALYGFVAAGPAFALLALAGVLTMGAGLLHGQALAGLGLVGGLATPLLVSSQSPSPWTVVAYAPLLVAAAHAFAWNRGWRGLALSASAGGLAWSVLLLAGEASPAAAPAHAVLQMALSAWTLCFLPYGARDAGVGRRAADVVMTLSSAALLLSLLRLGVLDGLGAPWLLATIAGAAIPLSLSSTRTAFRGYAGLAAAFGLGACATWPVVLADLPFPGQRKPGLGLGEPVLWPSLTEPAWFAAFAAALAATTAWLALRPALDGEEMHGGARHGVALAAAAAPPAMLALAWYRFTHGEASLAAATCAFATAALYAIPLRRLDRLLRAEATETRRFLTGSLLAGMVACVGAGLAFALTGNALTAALAVTAAAAARASTAYRSEGLRWTVAALGAVTAARLWLDPLLARHGLSTTPVLNGILAAYVVPALAFAYAGRILRNGRPVPDAPAIATEALALGLGAAAAAMEIRHLTHGGYLRDGGIALFEAGLYVIGAYVAAGGLVRWGARGNPVARLGGTLLALAGHAGALGILGVALNPALTNWRVEGGPILNDVTASYGLATLAAVFLARSLAARRGGWELAAARGAALLTAFLTVNLYVRMAFHEAYLGFGRHAPSGGVSQDELWAYSAAWLAVGVAFLAYGMRLGSWPARCAGFLLLAATVAKVFLVDMSGLDGFHRAAAFIGLGAVLMAVGFVYQRHQFRGGSGAGA